jgi:hypothetical protein
MINNAAAGRHSQKRRRFLPGSALRRVRMEKDILAAIVEVENEIQEQLVAEERSAGAMLCDLGQKLADEAGQEERRLKESVQQAVTEARAEAEERAAAMVRDAKIRAEQLAGLDEETLERCIMRHLVRILPGENR